MASPHFILVTYPAQGHINPALQFAKRLIENGSRVTFVTTVFAHGRISKNKQLPHHGLSFATFSDGHDDGHHRYKHGYDVQRYFEVFKRNGSRTINDVVVASENEAMPIACICYTLLLTWAGEVAREHNVPSALLWIQPATVFDVYYYYFNGYGDLIADKCCDKLPSIELPGLSALSGRDIPSLLSPTESEKYPFVLPSFREQMEALKAETNPIILVNSFDALEKDALRAIEGLNLVGIGPLIPSAYLNANDPSDTAFGGDLFEGSKDYIQWLNSKPESSVIYVSFGTIAELSCKQMEDIARALLDSGYSFLWVIRAKQNSQEEKEEIKLNCMEELDKQGLIVPWCSQVQVLSHPSVGCFMSHCGWNSTLESLVSGVPVVAFPQWTDQCTNAMLIERLWKTGVRVSTNREGLVESDEIKKCLDLVMQDGDKGQELRSNAKKWKELSREAVKEQGSSCMNLKNFLDKVEGTKTTYFNKTQCV